MLASADKRRFVFLGRRNGAAQQLLLVLRSTTSAATTSTMPLSSSRTTGSTTITGSSAVGRRGGGGDLAAAVSAVAATGVRATSTSAAVAGGFGGLRQQQQPPSPPQQRRWLSSFNSYPSIRSYPQYAVFGERCMLSVKILLPSFRLLGQNDVLAVDGNKKGRILLEWTPRSSSGTDGTFYKLSLSGWLAS